MITSERQQEIIQVAISILAHQGIQFLTMRELAKRVGIKESSIYYHFKNKQDILYAILANHKNVIANIFQEIHEINGRSIEELKAYFFKICTEIQQQPDYMKLFLLDIGQFQGIPKEDFNSLFIYPHTQIARIIKEGQENNEIRKELDIECITSTIRGFMHIILRHRLFLAGYDAREGCVKYWKFFEDIISIK